MGKLKVRVNDAWEIVGGGDSEVLVSDVDPYVIDPDASEELWYSPMVKQMFVRVNGEWRIATPNEVMVSRADPAPINPDVELWYDVDASPGHGAPKPPAIDEVWIGGQEPIKPTIELWYDTAATTVRTNVEYNDVTVNGDLDVDGVIQFPNVADVPKINLYADTFGVGIESGTQTLFASSTVRFRVGTPTTPGDFKTIPEVAAINASGLHPRTSIAGAMQNGWTGSVNFTVNPATVTADIDVNFPSGTNGLGSTAYKFCNIPAGASGPRATITMHAKEMTANYGVGRDVWVEARSDGLYTIFPGVNDGTAKVSPPFRLYTTMTWAR
jgi:hypothetical protein